MQLRIEKRALRVELLETRQLLTASLGWDGPGQGKATLNYYIGNAPASLAQSQVNSAIQTALEAWSDVANINFVQTNTPGLSNSLDFTFQRLDGVGGTLAQAYSPADLNPSRIAGDIQFDSSESWELGNNHGNAFDLVLVAVHEIGHALGVEHNSIRDSVMYAYTSPSQSFEGLTNTDVSAIRSLYAPAPTITSPTNPVSTPTTHSAGTTITSGRNVPGAIDAPVAIEIAPLVQFVTKVATDRFFAKYDSNADGLLNNNELPTKLWNRLAQRTDTNADTSLSQSELMTGSAANLQRKLEGLDANGDEKLSESEVSKGLWKKLANAEATGDLGLRLPKLITLTVTKPTKPSFVPVAQNLIQHVTNFVSNFAASLSRRRQ